MCRKVMCGKMCGNWNNEKKEKKKKKDEVFMAERPHIRALPTVRTWSE